MMTLSLTISRFCYLFLWLNCSSVKSLPIYSIITKYSSTHISYLIFHFSFFIFYFLFFIFHFSFFIFHFSFIIFEIWKKLLTYLSWIIFKKLLTYISRICIDVILLNSCFKIIRQLKLKTLSGNWKCFLFNSTLRIEKGKNVLFYFVLFYFISLNVISYKFIAYRELVVYDTNGICFRDFVKEFHTNISVHESIKIILNVHILLHIIPLLLCHIYKCFLLTYFTIN